MIKEFDSSTLQAGSTVDPSLGPTAPRMSGFESSHSSGQGDPGFYGLSSDKAQAFSPEADYSSRSAGVMKDPVRYFMEDPSILEEIN